MWCLGVPPQRRKQSFAQSFVQKTQSGPVEVQHFGALPSLSHKQKQIAAQDLASHLLSGQRIQSLKPLAHVHRGGHRIDPHRR
jgi:hypothetical protein